jgi:hypothetical protein
MTATSSPTIPEVRGKFLRLVCLSSLMLWLVAVGVVVAVLKTSREVAGVLPVGIGLMFLVS